MIKSWFVRQMLRGTNAFMRNRWTSVGKLWCWNRVCVPYLSWRTEEVVCHTKNGALFRVRPNDFVENRICFFGVWEPTITRLFEGNLKPGDYVVDVGANVGYYSVLSARLVGPQGQVYALEPSRSIRERLETNLLLNASANVQVFPVGAWHEPGRATLNLVDGNRGSSTLGATQNSTESESVELVRIDEVIPESVHSKIRLLKIDVEGAEWSALRGAERILEKAAGLTVICEVCPERLAALGSCVDDLLAFMEKHGYHAQTIANDYSVNAYLSNNQASLTPLILPLTESHDVLFRRV